MRYELSPCTYCCRVADPKNCDNKKCVPWKQWFLTRWEDTRKLFRESKEITSHIPMGIPLGGHYYPHPHQTREFLENGPCKHCKIPKDICYTPCPAQLQWKRFKEEHHELES